MSGVGEGLHIAAPTIHHGVLILDLYASQVSQINLSELQLLAVSCLMISTKYHEMKYPSAQSLNSATRNAYSSDYIIKKEGEIMKKINWDLLQYTVHDYVQLYLNQGCLFDSDEVLRTVNVPGQVQSKE
jgi:hypothetical protein